MRKLVGLFLILVGLLLSSCFAAPTKECSILCGNKKGLMISKTGNHSDDLFCHCKEDNGWILQNQGAK